MSNAMHRALAGRILAAAQDAGFDFAGIAPCGPGVHAEHLSAWLERGMHGSMAYLEDPEGRRGDPRRYLPWARSLVVVGLSYDSGETLSQQPQHGAISRYAWGRDYHRSVRQRLQTLREAVVQMDPGTRTHPFVDTSPILEKGVAQRAGIGWQGKHTNLIRKRSGSWFFLGGLATDLTLPASDAARDHCGTCRSCIDICPTRAIVAPYVLDARLCIAYLTIEHRGPIPRELRAAIGNRIFGCDDCQEVCPWNRHAQRTTVAEFHPVTDNLNPRLLDLIGMTRREWNRRFKKTPVRRAHYEGFIRNVAVALGNWADSQVVPALTARLDDESALVRGHVAWALGRVPGDEARRILEGRLPQEDDAWVREEITLALRETSG
jgi:epoxyqueuosine reductase